MEALACHRIFMMAEGGEIHLIWSFMHEDETALCPFPERRHEVSRLAILCKIRVGPEAEIHKLAHSIQEKGNLSAKDSIHIACASYLNADYFLTCDDELIKQSEKLKLELAIMNPIDYIRREGM